VAQTDGWQADSNTRLVTPRKLGRFCLFTNQKYL